MQERKSKLMVNMDGNDNQSKLVQIETGSALKAAQAALGSAEGPEYWRSLEELAKTPEFQERLHREFPHAADEWHDDVSRRGFLKLMSASLAMAGLTGCTRMPPQPIVPYVRQPEGMVAGVPLYFATAMDMGSHAVPVLVRSNEGRPSKIEGNPEHPDTIGGTDLFSQASVLGLYDPDRSRTTLVQGDVRPWPAVVAAMQSQLANQRAQGGTGFRLLTQSVTSPTLATQIQALQSAFPQMKWHQWQPLHRDYVRSASIMTFGQYVEAQYRLANADVIVSLDADFLYPGFDGFHRCSRDWAARRDPEHSAGMSRMYAIESTVTNTGFKADHRIAVRPSALEQYARALASAVGVRAGGSVPAEHQAMIQAMAQDLQRVRGRAVVIAGETAPPVVQALAHAMNAALGAVGSTVVYTDPAVFSPVDNRQSLRDLVDDMNAGSVQILVMLGGNPVFDAPADIDFKSALAKVPLKVGWSRYTDETSVYSDWHLSATHYLEEWSDARSVSGTVSIVQPLIAPLYGSRSAHEVLSVLTGQPDVSGYDLVRGYWQSQRGAGDFEPWWRKAVHDGFVQGSAFPERNLSVRIRDFSAIPASPVVEGLEVVFRRDPTLYDGRFAPNAWLQETPKPHTMITWDNPALISPRTAERFGIPASQDAQLARLELRGRNITIPVWVQPGHPDEVVTLLLGNGRERAGEAGSGKGVNTYQLRPADAPFFASGLQLANTGETYKLASRQGYQDLQGRNLVRAATLQEYREHPNFVRRNSYLPEEEETLPPNYEYAGHAWGMAVDLHRCTGCNACVVACQSENNVPVVGKAQVIMGRHMHWLRIDQYYSGTPSNPRSYFEPMMCVHCEKAPCELVCPVNATVHSSEGLNDMVYNRCVGTRYCSNNCPWKVRRFNFLLFQDWTTPQYKLMRNPEVTVRARGVMEKCTYCVQRIAKARIESERENRPLRDLEILTACQQACPTNSIVFGDINNRDSMVARWKQDARNYAVLEELNTRPRTSWLAAVLNPNPALPESQSQQQPEQQH
ncbi:MAG: TAT-variant-translocated molybdopterin oxidoreductase [Candidatus Korobacteraceae bacterium]